MSIAGAVVVAVNMVPSFESRAASQASALALAWLKARRSASLTLFTDRHGLRSRLLSSSQPVAHLPICPDGPFPGQ